ncbi:MAG: hypothetical protein DRJ10_17285 [Bacteroidetes bacterium]|nr:MAG: hypothetical protein DRJ10_17285 [Bacteroidota bacterium]RLD79669.1 MAG: hypothetical protein DRJ07_11435 [Bacteroidota bacterium]
METLTIKVKNKERLLFLYEVLRYYDFVELPDLSEITQDISKHDFFQSAGLWKNRDITQEALREKAWKRD